MNVKDDKGKLSCEVNTISILIKSQAAGYFDRKAASSEWSLHDMIETSEKRENNISVSFMFVD